MKKVTAIGAALGAMAMLSGAACASGKGPDNSTWRYANDAAYRYDQATAATGATLKHTLQGPTVGGENAMAQARAQDDPREPMPGYGINTSSDIGRTVVGPGGQILGTVSDAHGTVIDASGDQIGRVADQSGTVVDLRGQRIGSVSAPDQPQQVPAR